LEYSPRREKVCTIFICLFFWESIPSHNTEFRMGGETKICGTVCPFTAETGGGDQMLLPYIIQTDFKDVLSVIQNKIMRLLVTLVQPP
jgi:hypothetical protein